MESFQGEDYNVEFLTLHEIVRQAQRNLDKNRWDYLIGGADTEASVRRNRVGLDSWVFRPRILNDVSDVKVDSEFLGTALRIPVRSCNELSSRYLASGASIALRF